MPRTPGPGAAPPPAPPAPAHAGHAGGGPGSPSSPLQMTYFTGSGLARESFHLVPVGKPAPPRPRRPELAMASMTSAGERAGGRNRLGDCSGQTAPPAPPGLGEWAICSRLSAGLTGEDACPTEGAGRSRLSAGLTGEDACP